MQNEPIEVTIQVTQVLENLNIPYFISGSLACVPFLQSQLARAHKQTFLFETEVSAKFSSPEDIILAKLEWYRLGGEASERQWRDILGVLKTRAGELDLGYLRKWANELKVNDLMERALKEME